MKNYENVTILDHPLIRHKIAILRDASTGMKEFRELVEEITTLMVYESFKTVPTKKVMVQTPLEATEQTMVADNAVTVVPILRAGLGMVNGVHTLFPTAKVGHIGLYRDETTLEPHEYYCKLPDGIENSVAILLDPMLATGGSASAAIGFLKARGCRNIMLMSIIAWRRLTPMSRCSSPPSTAASTSTVISSRDWATRETACSAPSNFPKKIFWEKTAAPAAVFACRGSPAAPHPCCHGRRFVI